MEIRAWTKKDVEIVAEMEKRCFADPWSKEMLLDCLRYPYYHTFVAEEGGQVCGYGVLIALFEDGEVANIAVDAPFRGKGVGRAILEAMHQKARALGGTRALLEVRESNAPAIALYERFGYRPYGRRKGYYADGEDAILMQAALAESATSRL